MKILKNCIICSGTGVQSESRDPRCVGMIDLKKPGDNQRKNWRCELCQQIRERVQRRNQRRRKTILKRERAQKKADLTRRKFIRLKRKIKKLYADVADLKRSCSRIEKETLEKNIALLPETQKQAVRTCLETVKVGNRKGRRYAIEWMYECLLMRIKNSGLYDHIREREILPLPCRETLSRYIRRISSSAYEFQTAIFEGMKMKGSSMESNEKRGTLLVDEMKLSEAVSFNKQTLEFQGFVDLGQYTPEEKRMTRADHALVFMFQPFRGSWVQVLGSYLTKDSVTSAILHKLILECILLLSNSGFHVDAVVTDGAQWNRGTPDGIVQKKHWEALLRYEQMTKPSLKIAYRLTPTHLNPAGFQRMNVPLAFQLFDLSVRVAMEVYRNKPECSDLADSEATQRLCERTGKLIVAMMSRTPQDALRCSGDCPQRKAIIEFDAFLREWDSNTTSKEMPISASTIFGFKVTLGATLEILEVLHKEDGLFQFLMTARLNQDALERHFGMVRGSLGGNDHPDPESFCRLTRLLASYSLIKPPKNSNVSGTELLGVLMQTKDSLADSRKPRTEWLQKLDRMLEEGHAEDPPTETHKQDHDYELSFSMSTWKDSVHDHTYDVTRTSSEVQAYLAGFVARTMSKRIKCEDCLRTLKANNSEPAESRDAMIELMDQYGGLLRPTEELFRLTEIMESTVLDVVGKFGVKIDTLHIILDRLSELKGLPMVGCEEHRLEITRRVVDFYLVMRGQFLAKSFNANNNEARTKTKRLRKHAKLSYFCDANSCINSPFQDYQNI
ncbi:uncharacterized protein [Venturia canescens]|uniref:uncharacterized protein n=1 Tax=Venturia canescens TaxID=32260 RepID=UPI001C9C52E4|nr:uncharacterized protein LOC122406311 [Venturia canescens]